MSSHGCWLPFRNYVFWNICVEGFDLELVYTYTQVVTYRNIHSSLISLHACTQHTHVCVFSSLWLLCALHLEIHFAWRFSRVTHSRVCPKPRILFLSCSPLSVPSRVVFALPSEPLFCHCVWPHMLTYDATGTARSYKRDITLATLTTYQNFWTTLGK